MAISFLVAPSTMADVTSDQVGDSGRANLAFSSKEAVYESVNSDTEFNISFDYGSAIAVNYCYLGNIANAIRRADANGSNDSIRLTFYADDNSSFTTPESATVDLQLSDLMGHDLKDYVYSLSFTVNYRYYRCKIATTTGDSIKLILSSLWFGSVFDLGKSPDLPISLKYLHSPIYSNCGITLNYTGLNDTDRELIYTNLEKRKLFVPVIIYDEDDYLLTGDIINHTRLIDVDYTTKADGIYNVKLILQTEY